MKTITKISLLAVVAFALAACQPAANTNTNTNTNTNAAPKAAAPTADALMALEKPAWEAWKSKDGKFFETFLADNFVGFDDAGKRSTKTEAIKGISEHKCEVKSYSLTDPKMTPAGADAYVLTYKTTMDGSCEGKAIPSPMMVATVFVRSGDAWKGAYHNEVSIMEAPKPAGDANKNAAAAPASADKKDDMKADVAKKEAPAANTTASNSNSNSNSASTADALTDALMAVERRGWEAWMKQDAKGLQDTTTKDLGFVDMTGKATFGQADVIKGWTDGSCKVSSVNVSDGKGSMITKDTAILTYKGTAAGTCGETKLGPLWATSVFVKEGDVWRAAYIFETPPRK